MVDIDLGQLNFESGKSFVLERIKYCNINKEYDIDLVSPQGFCYRYSCERIGGLNGSKEMFKNIYYGLSKMNRQVILGRNTFKIE